VTEIAQASGGRRVLIAGVGNLLRGDDGFGPAVVAAFEAEGPPAGVNVRELGIGGVALVQELLDGYDALIIVDAVDRGQAPGTLSVLEPLVPAPDAVTPAERAALAADMHQLVPSRALFMARAVGVLPPQVWMVGCQPADTEELSMELSAPVRAAVPRAVAAIRQLVAGCRHPS
jgi:hydrogenase maturation protease